jgi:hypothetical protein
LPAISDGEKPRVFNGGAASGKGRAARKAVGLPEISPECQPGDQRQKSMRPGGCAGNLAARAAPYYTPCDMADSRSEKLAAFAAWAQAHITGDEKGQAQIFPDLLFQAFGHTGSLCHLTK